MQTKLEIQIGNFGRVLEQVQEAIVRIQNNVNKVLASNNFPESFRKALAGLPEQLEQHWSDLAQYGWFVNWETPIDVTEELSKGQEALDQFMIDHIDNSWATLTNQIIAHCSDRSKILGVAFSLHKEGNYVASIPLFMAQIDGICAQYLGTFLFSEHDKRTESINQLADESGDVLLTTMLTVLNIKTQFSARIGASSPSKKKLGPNRNGVLHGSRKHLDYGTKINSFKSFSLLAFIVMVLADKEFKSRKKSTHASQLNT